VDRTHGMIAVVGSRGLGLQSYMGPVLQNPQRAMPNGHEVSQVMAGITAEGMPDRWMGLEPFDVVVWNDPPPGSLGAERAQALKEWVLRGGHLVVVLPRVGETWTNENSNPLYDITPRVRVVRHEGVDLTSWSPLFTRKVGVVMPRGEILQTFEPRPMTEASDAVCILRGPSEGAAQGPCVVVRRDAGAGAVTLVGLDAASAFMVRNDFPEAELFWHRVLGRRGWTGINPNDRGGLIPREEVPLDSDIAGQIAKTGLASTGVAAGFVVFVAYWLMAGPVGYALLARTGRKRHAWAAFVLASGVFTAIAWGGARAIRPWGIETSHLTLIDHVYGQDVERARSWVSLLVPEYGSAGVSIGDPARPDSARFRNAIAPWDSDEGGGEGFPDARSYRIDTRDPRQVTIPTRSTVKQFQIDWAGASGWPMPRPMTEADGSLGAIRVSEGEGKPAMRGVLVHDLPEPLRDVYIVLNLGQRDIARSFAGSGAAQMTSNCVVYSKTAWAPGEPLDLSTLPEATRAPDVFKEFLSRVGRVNAAGQMDSGDRVRVGKRMAAVAFFPQLHPPEMPGGASRFRVDSGAPWATRRFTHGWDLGRFFTQPCVMIIGQVGDDGPGAASPVPVFVSTGGAYREAASRGRTVVRWIYPLPENPPRLPVGLTEPPAENRDGAEGERSRDGEEGR
jgi:hypothetical protein